MGVGAHSLFLPRMACDMVSLDGRGGDVRYPTLTAYAEGILCDFFQRGGSPEELKAREEAALVAVTRLYERRMAEIRTAEEMKRKTAMAAGTDHDGKEN